MQVFISLLIIFSSLQLQAEENVQYTIMYFYNPDCPSCQEIAPFIDYLRNEYQVIIYSYNTRNPVGLRYGMQQGIRYVPTMIITIARGEAREENRFEGINQIREAERTIAALAGKQLNTDPKQE